MKKLFYTLILGIMFSLLFIVPSSALSLTDIQNDPNYEVYTVTETHVMDIIVDTDNDYFQRDLYFDDYDVLYYDIQITNYAGMISIWYLGFYDYGGEDWGDYYSGDVIRVDQRCGGVRLELYADMPLDDVVIELRTCRYRLSESYGSSSDAYNKGYDDGYDTGYSDASGDKNVAMYNDAKSYFNNYDLNIDLPLIVPSDTISYYLRLLEDHYITVLLPFHKELGVQEGFTSGYDAAVDDYDEMLNDAYFEGYDFALEFGFNDGYKQGLIDAYDGEEFTESIDRLAENMSNTVFQVLQADILGHTLLELITSFVMIIIVLCCIPIVKSLL